MQRKERLPLKFISRGELFVVNRRKEVIQHEKTGTYFPRSSKSIDAHPLITVVFSIKKNDTMDLYLRVQNLQKPQMLYLNLELRDARLAFPEFSYTNRWVILGGWGMLLIIGLYVWVFFFYVRDSAFLYFGLFCFFYSLNFLTIEPEGGLIHLLSEYPLWHPRIFSLHFFSISALLRFGYTFVDLKSNFPKWQKYYQGLEVLLLLIAVTILSAVFGCQYSFHIQELLLLFF